MEHPDATTAMAATRIIAILCIHENYRPYLLHPVGGMKLFDTSDGWKLQ